MTSVTTIFSYEIKQISQSDTCHAFYGRTVINPLALEQDIYVNIYEPKEVTL